MNYCFLDAKTFYQFQELKKEGEDCGFPPHGSICNPGVKYGICGKGLECFKEQEDCFSPGICKKKTSGNNRFMILTSIKGKSCVLFQ